MVAGLVIKGHWINTLVSVWITFIRRIWWFEFLYAVEQHYGNNKQRNTLVREDFPKAKEEQEKEIVEAAEKHRQMVRQQ